MFFEHVRRCLFTINSREAVAGWWPEGMTRTEPHLGWRRRFECGDGKDRRRQRDHATMTRSQPPFKRTRAARRALSGLSSPAARTAGIGYVRPPLLPRQLRPLLPALSGLGQAAITDPDHRLNAHHESAVVVRSFLVSRPPRAGCPPPCRPPQECRTKHRLPTPHALPLRGSGGYDRLGAVVIEHKSCE
jgi:hypothetical protein